MSDDVAIKRLDVKRTTICKAINVIASDADNIPVEFAGLSVVDLMSAQSSLTAEINTRRRLMTTGIAA
ncbi:hypothetical protein ACFPIF_15730 [Brevundimonas faecalis]|uniref:hypothetical protein n=1 Tax=Brevundimonas faecalis TaxID=947378 RepID=UPI00361D0FE9